ncbi:glycosyltransferase family 2 protein [Thermoproteota archaeon]
MNKISVIILTHKRPENIRKSIKSVLNQTYKDWELIVIDDNDPQSSFRKETSQVMKEFPQIKYVKNPKNLGTATARKIGLKKAKGEYIAFLDDDDTWHPKKLELQLRKFKTSKVKNLGFVYCNCKYVEHGRLRYKTDWRFRGSDLNKFILMHRGIGPSTALMKRSLIKDVQNPLIYAEEDYIYELKLLEKNVGFDYCKEILVKYDMSGERMTSSAKKIESMKTTYRIACRYVNRLSFYEKMCFYANYHNKASNVYINRNMRMKAFGSFILSVAYNPLHIYRRKVLVRILFGHSAGDALDRLVWS